jgi:potassium/hydrogen antiporter
LHVVVRAEHHGDVEALTERWRTGPLGEPPVPALPPRGAPQVFSVRRWSAEDGDPAHPVAIEGAGVIARLRLRRDGSGSLVLLADGRYAVTSSELLAVGGRRALADWASRRINRPGVSGQEVAWWQEVAGALTAPAPSPRP